MAFAINLCSLSLIRFWNYYYAVLALPWLTNRFASVPSKGLIVYNKFNCKNQFTSLLLLQNFRSVNGIGIVKQRNHNGVFLISDVIFVGATEELPKNSVCFEGADNTGIKSPEVQERRPTKASTAINRRHHLVVNTAKTTRRWMQAFIPCPLSIDADLPELPFDKPPTKCDGRSNLPWPT